MHDLLSFSIRVEGHDGDADRGVESQLDIGPLVEGKEDRVCPCFKLVVLGEYIDAEGRLRVEPNSKRLLQVYEVVLLAPDARAPAESLSPDILHPNRGGVAEVPLNFGIVFDWDLVWVEALALKHRYVQKLRWKRIAVRICAHFLHVNRLDGIVWVLQS